MAFNRISPQHLDTFCRAVLVRRGMPGTDAAAVAASLIHADLIGISTHGVARLPSYVERLHRGLVNKTPEIKVETRTPWSVSIDADNAMGAVVADRAVSMVRQLSEEGSIGAAVVHSSNHFGAAGYYARALAGNDSVGICLSPASKSLAPFGTQEPLLGTNPWSVAVPAGKYVPWVMDMATSVAARGHIRIAAKEGKAIPEGWALDGEGKPTVDPVQALRGVMLPFAGPKGSAIAMMVEILGGVMAGSAFAGGIRDMNFDFEAPQNVGHFFLAWKIEAFMDLARFMSRMETLIERIKALKPAAGVSEVMYPGEIEARAMQANRVHGIAISSEIVEGLRELGQGLGLAFPQQGDIAVAR
jgi:L-2-hydroxycarboxylate dehydrogenase (NAD+)